MPLGKVGGELVEVGDLAGEDQAVPTARKRGAHIGHEVFHYRDRAGIEVDFVLELDGGAVLGEHVIGPGRILCALDPLPLSALQCGVVSRSLI
jgi:hypothetical protein